MSEQTPREFWLDIATPYGDPCDFVHTEDPYERAKRSGTEPCISATNIHVIEKAAYNCLKEHADKLAEALEFATMPITCKPLSLEQAIKTVQIFEEKIREVLAEYRKEFPK